MRFLCALWICLHDGHDYPVGEARVCRRCGKYDGGEQSGGG